MGLSERITTTKILSDGVKKRKIILLFFSGILISLCAGQRLSAQLLTNSAQFDSIYNSALKSDNNRANQYLKILEYNRRILTEPQKAKVNYLRLVLINSDSAQLKALDKRMFSAPDSLGYAEGLMYSARKYLEKSMPDKAVPFLMQALDTLKEGSDAAVYCRIDLCEAYREMREYKTGIEMLNEILSNKNPISDRNRAYACNRLAALYNEWGNPDRRYADSVFK